MFISEIKLQNFRNYKEQSIKLNKKINVFFGDNAQGKTNILESIFLCSIGKSFRTNKEKEIIKIGENFSKVLINYEKKDRIGKIEYELCEKKNIKVNGVKIKKLSELLGNINIVIFTPDDINILKGGPSGRRRFLDMMIGQLKPAYVYNLNMYLKYLEQRNTYLKQIKLENKPRDLLEIWNEKIIEYADKVYRYRYEYMERIKEKINEVHSSITDESEKIEIEYVSDYVNKKDFKNKLHNSEKNDINRGFTTKGIHKDDFAVKINDKLINIYGSQGQNRTAILSLKMCELQVIYDEIGEYPILLLDDFMSELDEKRRRSFLRKIENIQVIITCTQEMELEKNKYSSYLVKRGEIVKCT